MSALENDLTLFAAAMPADPRGTSPGIRAADFANSDGKLDYTILLMQDNPDANAFKGTMVLNIQGRYPNGRTGYIDSDPIPLDFGRYVHAQGAFELPSGMSARQVTIQVYPEGNDKTAAMRIINVR